MNPLPFYLAQLIVFVAWIYSPGEIFERTYQLHGAAQLVMSLISVAATIVRVWQLYSGHLVEVRRTRAAELRDGTQRLYAQTQFLNRLDVMKPERFAAFVFYEGIPIELMFIENMGNPYFAPILRNLDGEMMPFIDDDIGWDAAAFLAQSTNVDLTLPRMNTFTNHRYRAHASDLCALLADKGSMVKYAGNVPYRWKTEIARRKVTQQFALMQAYLDEINA